MHRSRGSAVFSKQASLAATAVMRIVLKFENRHADGLQNQSQLIATPTVPDKNMAPRL
jgi:hypothetical protein